MIPAALGHNLCRGIGRSIIKVLLNTDGGLLNVTGLQKPLVVWGLVIAHPNGTTLYEESRVTTQQGTSNEAEYLGVLHGLMACAKLGASGVLLRVDSQLVRHQLDGTYSVKTPTLKAYHKSARRLSRSFDSFRVEWVERSKNARADALCHQAMHLWRHQNDIPFKGKNKRPRRGKS